VVVAVSGGLDSCVLLHLARFAARGSGHEWIVAHYDHGMRPSSADDARWVRGLCRAWGVEVVSGRASGPLRSEAEARAARYDFLEEVRAGSGARRVFTAHHADDQAETVLFRLLRGAGSRGLGGIPARRGETVVRPLLDFWRSELSEYAGAVGLSWREDPTNLDVSFARNALRHAIIPEVERSVAPGARRALVRLARQARHEDAAWESIVPLLLERVGLEEDAHGFSVERVGLLELHPAVRARVIRAVARRAGVSLDDDATRRAVDFADIGTSGRAIELGRGLTFGVDLDRCFLGRLPLADDERILTIGGRDPGHGEVVLAGSAIPVGWGEEEASRRLRSERFDVRAIRFPLTVRSRRPGDRIRVAGGTKKVKKVLLEGRVPPSERHRMPVVVDAAGDVLWVPGLATAAWAEVSEAAESLRIGVG